MHSVRLSRAARPTRHTSILRSAALQLAAAVQAGPSVPDAIFDYARKHLSDRQLVELVGLVGYYWMLGRIATVFQVDLDVAQGTEVYDVGVQLAARKNQ